MSVYICRYVYILCIYVCIDIDVHIYIFVCVTDCNREKRQIRKWCKFLVSNVHTLKQK